MNPLLSTVSRYLRILQRDSRTSHSRVKRNRKRKRRALDVERLEDQTVPSVFTDDFTCGHYAATGWDGVLNPDHMTNLNVQNTGQLTWGSFFEDFGWEGTLDNGPVLYKAVSGDFDVSVQVTAMSRFSEGGLIARVPDLSLAGPGEDYVALRQKGNFFFDVPRSTDDGISTDNFAAERRPSEPFIRMIRAGDVFSLYTRPDTYSNWALLDQVTRPDLTNVADLQVGLWFGNSSASVVSVGSVQFDNFVLAQNVTFTAPIAADASSSTTEDTPLTGTVSAMDADGDLLSYSVSSAPSHGQVTMNPNGSFTYTPAANYYGVDSFTFTAYDWMEVGAPGTVALTITPVNDTPMAQDATQPLSAAGTTLPAAMTHSAWPGMCTRTAV